MAKLKPYDAGQCHAILTAAADAEIGVIIHTNSTSVQVRAMLYEARKGYPEYKDIQIRFSPDDPDNDLWVINNPTTEEPTPETRDEPHSEDLPI